MIERITIKGFKSLRDVTLHLGHFNLFIGANASGKTNFFEALRVLQGLARGLSVDEVFNGKFEDATGQKWAGIRGGSANACFATPSREFHQPIHLLIDCRHPAFPGELLFEIVLDPLHGRVMSETLAANGKPVYRAARPPKAGLDPAINVSYDSGEVERRDASRAVLTQLQPPGATSNVAIVTRLLQNMQFLDPDPSILRDYSLPIPARRLGERGENFAAVVQAILANPQAGYAFEDWLKHLTPVELDSVHIRKGAKGEPIFGIKRGSRTALASVLSDGTLRFAAMVAGFFQPNLPGMLLLEEVENGIHPTCLRLLVDLLRSQSAAAGVQVLATTHSPSLLAWIEESDYPHVFVFDKDEAKGASRVRQLAEVPGFLEVVQRRSIADLMLEGWLETVP